MLPGTRMPAAMNTVAELVDAIDTLAPLGKAASWDPVGLQLGDPDAPVRRIGVCHEVTQSVVDGSADLDAVVTYHPLLFRPTTRLVAGSSPAGRALALIEHRTALVVVHTALDVAPGGTSDALADALGLSAPAPIGPIPGGAVVKVVTFVPADHAENVRAALAQAGAGQIGAYRACSFESEGTGRWLAGDRTDPLVGDAGEAGSAAELRLEMLCPESRTDAVIAALWNTHPYDEPAYDLFPVTSSSGMLGRLGSIAATPLATFAESVFARLGSPGGRVAGDGSRTVTRVAVAPGSGSDLIAAASGGGADVLVTADVSHHRAVEALDRGMAVVDAGHIPTERPGLSRFVDALRTATPDTDVADLTEYPSDPWRRS